MNPSIHKSSWPELATILLVRLSVLWILVLISLTVQQDDTAFYAFMGIAFSITIPYSLWLRNKLRSTQFAPLQFLVDLILVTGLIYFTGGIHSNLTLLYPLVILSAGIVSTPRQAAQVTLLSMLIYALMIIMLSHNMLVAYLPEGKEAEPTSLYSILAIRIFTFALFGVVSIYISKRGASFQQHNQDAQKVLKDILSHPGISAFILNRDGEILDANPAACKGLNTKNKTLVGQKFTDLCLSGFRPIPTHYGPSAYLQRTQAPPLPISFHSEEIHLPDRALSHTQNLKENSRSTLLVYCDISHSLTLERQMEKLETITAATRVAGEMAHEIRTPLTAISASVQLLKHYEDKASAADWLPNSPRKKDRIELFEHITGASEQMDTVVQNFIDFAEFSPADLISIIKLDSNAGNQSYIGHLNKIAKGFENGQNSDRRRRPHNPQFTE